VVDDESVDATLTEDSAEDTGSVDWQKRYTDTQAEYTRNQQALADERKVWEDEQALLARVQEKFPHLLEEGEEETEDETDFEDTEADPQEFATRKELDEFKAWKQQIDQERGESLYKQHLAEELGDREIPEKAQAWIKDRTISLGAHRNALKQAVEEFDAISAELGSKKKSRPKAPHVTPGGQPGTGVKDFSQMSRSEIDEWMVERARALEAQ
jgi:hypothetical protein